jgi:hypothetical protein
MGFNPYRCLVNLADLGDRFYQRKLVLDIPMKSGGQVFSSAIKRGAIATKQEVTDAPAEQGESEQIRKLPGPYMSSDARTTACIVGPPLIWIAALKHITVGPEPVTPGQEYPYSRYGIDRQRVSQRHSKKNSGSNGYTKPKKSFS